MTILNLTKIEHYGHNEIIVTVPLEDGDFNVSKETLLESLCKLLGIHPICLSITSRGISRRSNKAFIFLFDDKMN